MAGTFSQISAELKTLVTGVQLSSSAAFVEIDEFPTNQFTGFPAATIVPADVQSAYATVNENQRTYSFEVCLFIAIPNPGDMAAEFAVMRDLVDGVLDAFEKSIDLGGLVRFLVPVPMKWQVVAASGSGQLLAAPIHLSAQKDVVLF